MKGTFSLSLFLSFHFLKKRRKEKEERKEKKEGRNSVFGGVTMMVNDLRSSLATQHNQTEGRAGRQPSVFQPRETKETEKKVFQKVTQLETFES